MKAEIGKPGTLTEALSMLHGLVQTIKKTRTARVITSKGSYSYMYADLGDILAQVGPILAGLGVAFTQLLREEEGRTYLVGQLRLGAEQIESKVRLPVEDASPQAFGSVLSYYRRYQLCAMLSIQGEEDDDAQAGEAAHRSAARPASPGPVVDPPIAERRAARVEETLQRELGAVPVVPDVLFSDNGHRVDGPTPAPEPPGEVAERRPTKKQLGLLFARTREAGIEPGDMRQLMKALWGASSSEALTMSMFRQLVGDSKAGVPGILDDLREKRVTIPQLIAEVTP